MSISKSNTDKYGKNKIIDIFEGSNDANILILSDDANGDALFVDDIYSDKAAEGSRLTQIKEILAGAGDDVVDLTSQKFAYSTGVKVHGGLGDDVIWANSGENRLFGDAGDFGNDIVNQLDGGSVTLYFDSEDVQWDEDKNAYTDGRNSVTLNGDFEVTVHYETPDELSSIGAFEDFTSEKIFKDKPLVA